MRHCTRRSVISEQALSNRSSDLHQKEQEQKLHFEKEKQELQLEKERHELQLEKERHALQLEREKEKFRVEKRESDLQFRQRELDIDSKALGLREEKLQIAKQEHEQSVKKQEEELKAKERNIRAESLQLKNQQKQNEVYFRKREEDLQFRERNLHLTERNLEVMIQENKVLKERMKNLKSENSKLREEVDRLNDQIAVLLPDETQPNGEPLMMSEDTADVDLPTVEASSSYSNGVPWPMSVEEEGEGRVLVPQVNHIPMQRASLEQSNHRRSWWQEYVVLNRLGGGTYGVVYHVRHRVDGVEYAMKIIRVPSSGHGEEMDKKLREVHALAKLDHPRIVRYYHSRVEELPAEWLEKGVKLNSTDQKAGPLTCLFIQTELCRGTFRGWLEDTEKTKKRERITVLKNIQQIQEAVLYIHQEGYIHRDLKPSNIFFSLKDGSIKVGDFGLVTQSETECEATGSTTPKHTGNAGTIFYRAPEQMSSGQTYDQKVDIFAIGVILFESNMFFQNENEYREGLMALKENRLEKILPQFVQRLPCEAALIGLLTSYDPSERPTVEEVFQSQQWKDFQKNTGDPTNVPELDP